MLKKVVMLQPFRIFFVYLQHDSQIILNAMRTQPTLTLADMKEGTGISITAIQKLLDQMIQKKYVERGEKDGSWRVFVTQ